jgi:NADH-quinone oxidoreductase subunit H
MNMITMSAVMVTLFFGGPDGPGFHVVRWLWPILWFAGKTFVFICLYVWIRAALPRLRYDQLMELGWKVLIPLSLGWLLVVAAFRVGTVWGLGVFFGFAIVGTALWQAVLVGRGRREELEQSSPERQRPAADSYLRAVPEPDGGG